MCPACMSAAISTAAVVATGALSAGGIGLVAVRRIRSLARRERPSIPAPTEAEKDDTAPHRRAD